MKCVDSCRDAKYQGCEKGDSKEEELDQGQGQGETAGDRGWPKLASYTPNAIKRPTLTIQDREQVKGGPMGGLQPRPSCVELGHGSDAAAAVRLAGTAGEANHPDHSAHEPVIARSQRVQPPRRCTGCPSRHGRDPGWLRALATR
jgi:hypothetical protein